MVKIGWITVWKTVGKMAERSNAAVLKTVDLRGSGGSNPSLSAKGIVISRQNLEAYSDFSVLESRLVENVSLWNMA